MTCEECAKLRYGRCKLAKMRGYDPCDQFRNAEVKNDCHSCIYFPYCDLSEIRGCESCKNYEKLKD